MNAPNLPIAATETDETYKTYAVSNDEFLRSLFPDTATDIFCLTTSFVGNPSCVNKSAWNSHAWQNKKLPWLDGANHYFSLASFRPDEAGIYRRRKGQFVALHAIMLDDIGGKISMDRVVLPPSWLLETSPNNHQAGYLLAEPVTDGLVADRLMNAIVSAGLCDPGANGPRARLARLPDAVNGKHEPPFPCRMVIWRPELRYSPEEIAVGLQLDASFTKKDAHTKVDKSCRASLGDEEIWLPRPERNVVIQKLKEQNLYKSPLGEGKHDITCPWVEEHTGSIDDGTAYFEPDDTWPIGGFKCHHGHCAERHIRDLLKQLEIKVDVARMKPTIRVSPGEIHRIVDVAERELASLDRHYQRGGLIATVITDPGTRETRVKDVSQNALVSALSGAALWERWDKRSEAWLRVDPPARHVGVLFDATSYSHLPVLSGLTRQPFLRSDGSLLTVPGYDLDTGMFGVFDAREFQITDNPHPIEAELALWELQELLSEFSFASAVDRTAALAAILTAAIRPSLPVAPMFHIRAHMVGSGKSYLCELITAFATPQRGTPTTFPADDEECRKLLLAELLRGPAVIEFDNLTSDLLAHKSLCTALTSEFMSGRILGVSKTATVSTRALFLSSGNNVSPIQDMTRRCLTIRLAPECEIPATRSFKRPNLVRDVLSERGRYVSLALTIIRAWIADGRPMSPCKPLVSYGDWSDLCRQPLLWLGCPDPTESLFEAMAEDPDRETLSRMLHAWHAVFGQQPRMVREVVCECFSGFPDQREELREVITDVAGDRGDINRRKLGWWIKRHSGRIVDGLRFVRSTGNSSAERWRVETVGSVSSVLSVSPTPIVESVSEIDILQDGGI